jgi:polyisoprenoid-binding protein YceI
MVTATQQEDSPVLKFIFGAVAAVFVVAVALSAAWYFFIREDNEPKTTSQTITPELIATTTALAAAEDGEAPAASAGGLAFVVVPEQSEATYLAGETLANVGLPSTALGATNEIAGTIFLTGDGWALDPSQETVITVQLANLQTGEDRRDNRVREALNVTEFPEATFVATSVTGVDSSLDPAVEQTFQLTGLMTLHGVEKEVTWEVKARREGDILTALATLDMLYADFNITPPNIAGFVSVEDDVTLQMDIVATQQG